MTSVLAVLLVSYLPGALLFRLPLAERSRRASLPAEERVFWSVLLSLALSSLAGLGLAAAGLYRFSRLLWIDGGVCLLLLVAGRSQLRLRPAAPLPTWTTLVPIGLIAAAWWLNFFVPPSEYVIGGKDPGVYMNEGIQIAQRGTLTTSDPVVASVPASFRDLFFPSRGDPRYYSNRFMGFFLLDPGQGTVVGQFPHLYPVWIAIAYGVNGLTGARWVVGLWAILGVLAVYFAGARIAGRAAATAGAGLLAVHVLQVWYARYPNAELVMQPLIFAGLLAYVRAHVDGDRFFAPVAAVLLVFGAFAHFTGVLAIGALAVALVLGRLDGQPVRLSFWLPLVVGTWLMLAYLSAFLPPYYAVPLGFVNNVRTFHVILLSLLAAGALFVWWGASQPVVAGHLRAWCPTALVLAVWMAAAYALVIRSAGGSLASYDADALRTFTSFYFSPLGLVAALTGFFVLRRRSFWTSGPLLLTVTAFSFFFFYKLRIVPEHFWMARRFLPVILPGALLLVGAAAFSEARFHRLERLTWLGARGTRLIRCAGGLILVALLGRHFVTATRAIVRHVEYAGLIPRLEQLAATFGDDDLVLVESRGASDVHVLALPLAYIYARNVLVLESTSPEKGTFRDFLDWARGRYRRVFFLGGGGTELLSRAMAIGSIGGDRFQIPEYESAWNAYPHGIRNKELEFSTYEFLPGSPDSNGFVLDVGTADDLYLRRFHAKERLSSGATFRWTRGVSYVSIIGTRPEHQQLTLWIADGGRPAAAGPATVEVFLNDKRLGTVTVGSAMEAHHFTIPPELAASIAGSADAAQLRIVSSTWSPQRVLGSPDSRDLGVMIDRIEVR